MTGEAPEVSPLDKLEAAVQEFAAAQADGPVHVVNALVVYEQLFADDGRQIKYASTGGFTLSGSLGLADAARTQLQRDVLGRPDDD